MLAAATRLCKGANSASASIPFRTRSSTRTADLNRVPPCTTRCPTASTRETSSFASNDRTVRSSPFWRVASAPSETSSFAMAARSTVSTMLPLSELEPTFRTRTRTGRLVRPGPVAHVRHVLAVIPRVLPVPQSLVHHVLPDVTGARPQPGNPVDDIHHQVEAVEVVQHHHVKRGRRCPLLLVAAHVEVIVVLPPVGQPMDQPGIAVIGEEHRPVGGDEGV